MSTYKDQFKPWKPNELTFDPVIEAQRIGVLPSTRIIVLYALAANCRNQAVRAVRIAVAKHD